MGVAINLVGDILLAGKIEASISREGIDSIFRETASIFRLGDINIGNLECPLSGRGEPGPGREFIYRAPGDYARGLKRAGFNIMCLANNHIMDFGPVALLDTISSLEKNGILHVGAGRDLGQASKPLVFEGKDLKIAFLAFTYSSPAGKKSPGTCRLDPGFMKKKIKEASRSSDLVIAMIHHGVEYVDYPNRFLISLFRGAAEAGAALVVGHHPHVCQGIENYRGSLIAYSLGNFISSYADEEERRESYAKTALAYFTNNPPGSGDMRTTESFVLRCELDKSGVQYYELIPVKSNPMHQSVLMDAHESAIFLKRIGMISKGLYDGGILDEMDELWEKCRIHAMSKTDLAHVLRRFYKIRPSHLSYIIPYLKSRLT